jgi:hypothetical protein
MKIISWVNLLMYFSNVFWGLFGPKMTFGLKGAQSLFYKKKNGDFA